MITLKYMKNYILFIFALFMITSLHAQDAIKNVIVETYYVSDANDATDIQYYYDSQGNNILDTVVLESGTKTYRVYIQMQPGYKLLSVFGDKIHALKFASTANFFNNADYGKILGMDITEKSLNKGTVALDTWLTLGQTTTTSNGKTNYGVLKSADRNGSFIGGANNKPKGLLANTDPLIGIPLTTADGMDTMNYKTSLWRSYGLDTSIFNLAKANSFISYKANLNCSGIMGVNRDSNIVLVAQLTTKGEISFELNVKVIKDGKESSYVASGKDSGNIKVSAFLKYPLEKKCGCDNPDFQEYRSYVKNKYNCSNIDSCKHKIIFGCRDPRACNYNPNATDNMLCCYPGDCADRDISLVCPDLGENKADVSLFPNPASNKIEINLVNINSNKVLLSVYDVYGKKYIHRDVTTAANILELDLSTLVKGVYVLRVQNNMGVNISKYLVKK
jgi:hypothetical protein